MKAYRQLAIFLAITLVFPLFSLADVTDSPSFDCKKAASTVEKIICNNEEIAKSDREMASLVSQFHALLADSFWESFLTGQRNWLKLRAKACLLDVKEITDEQKKDCVQSVYQKRIEELHQRMENWANNKDIDFDRLLDEKSKLVTYLPENLSAMRYAVNDNFVYDKGYVPTSCRELYVFSSGLWSYTTDTVGANSSTYAQTLCGFKLVKAFNKTEPNTDKDPVNFSDFAHYSTEFECWGAFPVCHLAENDVTSLTQANGIKKLTDDIYFTLGSKANMFSISGQNYTISDILTGDFTRQGRKEALLSVHISVTQGTFQNNALILVYYDTKKKIIRPEFVDYSTIYRVLTKPAVKNE